MKIILSRMLILGQEMIKRVLGSAQTELLSNWTIQAWANVNRYGHYNKFHNHIRNLNQPEPGLMLLFPSSLGHRVETHYGTGDRITIAFNLKNDRFTTINYEIDNHSASKS